MWLVKGTRKFNFVSPLSVEDDWIKTHSFSSTCSNTYLHKMCIRDRSLSCVFPSCFYPYCSLPQPVISAVFHFCNFTIKKGICTLMSLPFNVQVLTLEYRSKKLCNMLYLLKVKMEMIYTDHSTTDSNNIIWQSLH